MRILFVGNSYTYYNDMPELLARLAADNGVEAEVYSVTKGGWKLHRYLDRQDEAAEKFKQAVAERCYDAAILQEQSFLPLADFEKFADGAAQVAKAVGAKRTIVYQTWGRKEGSPTLAEHGWDRKGMTEGLAAAYGKVAAAIGAEISPVGTHFYAVGQKMPELELYNPDLSHPSYAGSCLAALTHYHTLFGSLPEKTDSLNLPADVVELFKSVIKGE